MGLWDSAVRLGVLNRESKVQYWPLSVYRRLCWFLIAVTKYLTRSKSREWRFILAPSSEEQYEAWCEAWQGVVHSVVMGDLAQLAHISANQNTQRAQGRSTDSLWPSGLVMICPHGPIFPHTKTSQNITTSWDSSVQHQPVGHISYSTHNETRNKCCMKQTCEWPMEVKRVKIWEPLYVSLQVNC